MTAPSPQVDGAGPAAPRPLRVATRRSALALAQSRAVGEQLATLTGRPLELVEVTTQGDVDRGPLAQIGGTGVFVAAVREAVAEGRADVAVHSLKDLPTAPDPRLELAAVPLREDPRDALVAGTAATLAELPTGARVGTGSPRRRAQLAAIRPDLELVDLRGNVDTRLGQVRGRGVDAAVAAVAGAAAAPAGTGRTEPRPDLDAVVLATAGLSRLDRADRISEHLDPDVMLPAPGHTKGNAVAVLEEGGLFYMFQGDVTYCDEALKADELSVVAEDLEAARKTLDTVREFVQQNPTVYLSTHCPEGYENLEQQKVMKL